MALFKGLSGETPASLHRHACTLSDQDNRNPTIIQEVGPAFLLLYVTIETGVYKNR